MALLTELSLADCQSLGIEYGIDVRQSSALAAGSVNSNFLWEDNEGVKYFARLYEEQDKHGATREALLNLELARAGVPVARPIERRDGGWVTDARGKPLAVFAWVEGELLCQARVTPSHCRALGSALATMHRGSPSTAALGAGRFGEQALLERLDVVEACSRDELRAAALAIRPQLQACAARRLPLPAGLSHGDLFRDNCLWRGTSIQALLDFESACHGSFTYDLMVTLLAWCYSDAFVPELVEALLVGYHQTRPLTAEEIAAAPTEAAFGCLRFATTRLTDYSLRVPPGAPPLRDYRRFLARLQAIETGALSKALASLQPISNARPQDAKDAS